MTGPPPWQRPTRSRVALAESGHQPQLGVDGVDVGLAGLYGKVPRRPRRS
jgi:hypothetical protein